MSVDTRTPGFDEQPALSMIKVDCDPAQVIVNHASFRVQLAPSAAAKVPAMGRRRAPVVWSGKSEPGDPAASGLLQAVRNNATARATAGATATATATATRYGGGGAYEGDTQVIPRIDDTMPTPLVGGGSGTGPLLPPMRQAVGAYDDEVTVVGGAPGSGAHSSDDDNDDDRARHAYYPGRRMNLGVVLLPMRVFLGFISIYAGMGKLCDPVYFDGGERGSMVKWLNSLHPWALAEPLRDFALSHPVGAGLTVAFLQVVVGVLTVLGLWQRVAACVGTLLSAALLMTVSWKTVPVYDAPDIIYLAAWSPLIIAGAPVYSVDARLAGEAWRTLGPRSELWDLRRRVLRRGAVMAAVVVGLTLLIGSVLGGAVRSADVVTVPGPNDDPTNHLPGAPLPRETGERRASEGPSGEPRDEEETPEPTASSSGAGAPSDEESEPSEDTAREGGGQSSAGRPSETQGTGTGPARQEQESAPEPPQQQSEPEPPPSSAGPTSSGGTGGSDSPDDGDDAPGPIGGLLG
ncbi:DoxX family membrane protein [Streptomyces sp. NPDC050504]|uniref:DoxX family membrane protein n=1 Tax=Streptomyces sp. NPDC050504 TaxID=3365618 RepID=UPI00378B6B52